MGYVTLRPRRCYALGLRTDSRVFTLADSSTSTAKPTGGTVRRACDPCRTSKSACNFKEQSSICAACERKHVVCTSSFGFSESAPPVRSETALERTTNTPIRRTSSSSVVEAPNAEPTSLTPDELARVDSRRTTEEPISKDANVQRLIAVYFFRIYNVSWSVPLPSSIRAASHDVFCHVAGTGSCTRQRSSKDSARATSLATC